MTNCSKPTKENLDNVSIEVTPMLNLAITFKKINLQNFNALFHTLVFESVEINICLLGPRHLIMVVHRVGPRKTKQVQKNQSTLYKNIKQNQCII